MANELGRNRKPAAQRELEGNRSRRPIPADWAPAGAPECPEHLSPIAREHFTRVCALLAPCGVVRQTDALSVEALARSWERFTLALSRDDDDVAVKWLAKWALLASKFGLTPSDRQKLIIDAGAEPDENEVRFFKVTG